MNIGLHTKGYEIIDFGSYYGIKIQYSIDDVKTRYKVDRGYYREVDGDYILIPSNTLEIEFYGFKRGYSSTQTIKLDISYKKVKEVSYYSVFTSTSYPEQSDYVDYNTYYMVDVDDSGYSENSFPRAIRTKLSSSENYIIIEKSNEDRLDFVAEEYLGNGRLWWVLAEYNLIVDPFNVPVGTRIQIPDISELYSRGGSMRLPELKLF